MTQSCKISLNFESIKECISPKNLNLSKKHGPKFKNRLRKRQLSTVAGSDNTATNETAPFSIRKSSGQMFNPMFHQKYKMTSRSGVGIDNTQQENSCLQISGSEVTIRYFNPLPN